MIVIVAGSRSIEEDITVCTAIGSSGFDITCLVSGGAVGVDRLGEKWAKDHYVPTKRFPANWEKYGKRAGYVRNVEMADYIIAHADEYGGCAVIAVWDGSSKGTEMMVNIAKEKGVKLFVYDAREPRGCVYKNKPKRPLARWAQK